MQGRSLLRIIFGMGKPDIDIVYPYPPVSPYSGKPAGNESIYSSFVVYGNPQSCVLWASPVLSESAFGFALLGTYLVCVGRSNSANHRASYNSNYRASYDSNYRASQRPIHAPNAYQIRRSRALIPADLLLASTHTIGRGMVLVALSLALSAGSARLSRSRRTCLHVIGLASPWSGQGEA